MRAVRFAVAGTAIVALAAFPATSQEVDTNPLIEGLNRHLSESAYSGLVTAEYAMPPEWGIAIKGPSGEFLDVFGQVPYEISAQGEIFVPGYTPPQNSQLELVPAGEWTKVMAAVTSENVDPAFAPITNLPQIVGDATDYLAGELCAMKGRPSSITLILMIGASGNIFFAEASTDAGSEVTWDFANDVCRRYEEASAEE